MAKKRIFSEVRSDHEADGEIYIDGYRSEDQNEPGIVVAIIENDGYVRLGDYAEAEFLLCELVQEHIREAVQKQLVSQTC